MEPAMILRIYHILLAIVLVGALTMRDAHAAEKYTPRHLASISAVQ